MLAGSEDLATYSTINSSHPAINTTIFMVSFQVTRKRRSTKKHLRICTVNSLDKDVTTHRHSLLLLLERGCGES